MNINRLASLFQKDSRICQIRAHRRVHLQGLVGSGVSLVLQAFKKQYRQTVLVICRDKERAAYLFNDLELFISEKKLFFFPSSHHHSKDNVENINVLTRTKVLKTLLECEDSIIISYPEALSEKILNRDKLNNSSFEIKNGDVFKLDKLNEQLFEYHFRREDFVSEPGEFALRGGIIDIFSFANDKPYRIEFFGDTVESIRTFDVESQLSDESIDDAVICPGSREYREKSDGQSLFEYIGNDAVLWFYDLKDCIERLEYDITETDKTPVDKSGIKNVLEFIKSRSTVELSTKSYFEDPYEIMFNQQGQPPFNKKFDLLIETLNRQIGKGFSNCIFCSNASQVQRLKDIFQDIGGAEHYNLSIGKLYGGFVDNDLKTACFTDHQIFGRYHKFHLKGETLRKKALGRKMLEEFAIDDYITHIDHGVGIFSGLRKVEVNGKIQEAVCLQYDDGDLMYVGIHALYKLSKYRGKDGVRPKIHKLGGKEWKAVKARTKKRVKEVAFSLIDLYAKRQLKKGFAFAPDSYLQYELEASFLYEDTPDQITSTEAVKADMEKEIPMDRLICGDVGFGKTEVAIRAAFKAVDNSKQVVVLVPTTVLSFQHFRTFSERLKDLPVTVDYLNRFRTAKDRNSILKRLEDGKIDIIIGTHQLINKAIKYKDLGLLIVDEEQKFGVAVKEKLRTLKENIDVLTLTATPIPRTLQFSLLSARDMSVITTPPPNRYPIESRVVDFDTTVIQDALTLELERGGQVFFVHNRVDSLKEIAETLRHMAPDAKIAIGHGQMPGKDLEKIMIDFMEHRFDILVSTTIVESGLDIPNANTIFIDNAHNFGLSDLHQMRGRVGRSNKKAYCYFITVAKTSMTDEAHKRISALEEFSDLGSGFYIAMKDLEIRGAGDLLGGEQTGFINEMGLETYQKILQNAVEELKEQNFENLYKRDLENKSFVREVQIDTDLRILIPDDYINSSSERLRLYRELSSVRDEMTLENLKMNIKDRFGTIPSTVVELLESIHLKWICANMGVERIILKNDRLKCYFIGNQDDRFYSSERFETLFQNIQQSSHFQIQQKETRNGIKLILSASNIASVTEAMKVLKTIDTTSDHSG